MSRTEGRAEKQGSGGKKDKGEGGKGGGSGGGCVDKSTSLW